MIAYTGIETISNMSEEAKDASRTVPRAAGLVVAAVLGLYLLIPIVALSAMPVTQNAAGHYTTALGTEFANDPILGIVENLGLSSGLTEILRYYVGILAAVILLIATNAGLIGVSRLTYSMGQHRQLPEGLRQVHPKYRTPYIAILIFSAIAIDHPDPGQDRLPGDALLVRRDALVHDRPRLGDPAAPRKPDEERPWKPPLNFRFLGFEIPLTAVLGGLGTFAAWIVVMALNPRTLVVGDRLDGLRDGRLRPLPPQPGPAADADRQGRDAGAARGRGDRVPQRPRRLRGRRAVLGGDGRDRGQARLASAAAASTSTRCSPSRPTCRSTPSCPSRKPRRRARSSRRS